MKAQSMFTFSDDEGKTRKVKTIINDDFSIHSFYFEPTNMKKNQTFEYKTKKKKKLGDWVKNTIDFFTYNKVKPCNVCKKRQAMLNQIMQKEKTNG
jgi:hypothetical protein